MIRHIARREALEHARSPRFIVLCALALTLMPLTAFVAARGYETRAAWAGALESSVQVARLQSASTGDEMATRFGWRSRLTQADPALRAVRPPSPGSVFAAGLDGSAPSYWQFSTEGVEDGPSSGGGSARADNVDLTLVVELVLGLLAILSTYDSVSGERESGLLRTVLAHPVSRIDVLIGKFLGAAAGLTIPLVLGAALSALVLVLSRFPLAANDVWPRLVLFAGLAAAYLATLLALGLLVSAVCRQARTALFAGLVLWVSMLVVVPQAALSLAAATRPLTPRELARLNRVEGVRGLERGRGRALGQVWRATSGSDLPPADGVVSADVRRRYDDARTPIEREFTRAKRDLLRDAQTARVRSRARQERLADMIGSLSPTVTFRAAAAAVAGTGSAYRDRWELAAARHQRILEQATFDRSFGLEIYAPAFDYLRVIIWPNPADPAARVPPYADLPQFAGVTANLGADLREAAPLLAVLAVEATLLLFAACGAFLWNDVV